MGLSPDDIVNYPLKQAVRGYSVAQVDDLLDQVADTVERLEAEVETLRERLQRSEERLAGASETEATLKRTLVTAQRAAEQSLEEAKERSAEMLDEARRESASVLEQARLEAEELRVEALQAARAEEADIRRRRQALEGHIEALRIFEREYRARLRGHLEGQLRMLDEVQNRPLNMTSGGPDLAVDADAEEDVLPVDVAHLGGATVPDEPQLTIRVRDEVRHELRGEASDDPSDGLSEDLSDDEDDELDGPVGDGSDDDLDVRGDRSDARGEVGSAASRDRGDG